MEFENRFAHLAARLGSNWRSKARPEQLPPSGDWLVWLLLAGRGFGKTRTGAETVQEWITTGQCGRLALVAPTAADVRDVIVEGPSGMLKVAPKSAKPLYEPSKRRLTWPNYSDARSKCGGRAIEGRFQRTLAETGGGLRRTLRETGRAIGETDARSSGPTQTA